MLIYVNYFVVLPSFSSWDKTAVCFTCLPLMPSTIYCWSNGLSLPPLATALVIFLSLYFSVLLLCQPLHSDASDCRIWDAIYIKKTHPIPNPQTSSVPCSCLHPQGCSQPSDASTQGNSARWEEAIHGRAAITMRVTQRGKMPALMKKRSILKWSLNVKNRVSGHWQWAVKLWEIADL